MFTRSFARRYVLEKDPLNNPFCSLPRPLTAPEAGVIVIIVIVAATLAVLGLPTASVILLITEAASLGTGLLLRLRRSGTASAQPAEV
ncbi:hypothetical protein [Streptomyces sp. NPDC020489]|uniref:hypothetical protein n=1 Tax=Streptomyces sp. NPDC020489 TaxID=3365077 RepID=UPI0037891A64